MRVTMYVQNDVTRDSRVLREATTLAAAGHAVTVMATALADGPDRVAPEPAVGLRILRVPQPSGRPWWVAGIRSPWQLRHPAALLLLPWTLLRGGWVLVVNHLLRRPVSMGWVEYVRRWRVVLLGWCRDAASVAPTADVHHAHDLETLPAALAAARRDGGRVVYDSHEVFMGWGPTLAQPAWLRAVLARWERRLARRAAAVITVNPAVAAVLRDRVGVRRVVVVRNCAVAWDPPAVPEHRIRRALGLADDTPLLLCHGALVPGRGLAETAAALLEPGLESVHLVFLGYGGGYAAEVLTATRTPGRIHRLPPVPPDEVVAWVADADVDVIAISAAWENGYLSTPNKLFESIAAGVPVVVSDFPAMREIVLDPDGGPLGAVCDPSSPASIAAAVRSILVLEPAERDALRRRVREAARRRWNWAAEAQALVELYEELGSAG